MACDVHWLPGREKTKEGYAQLDFVVTVGLYWVRAVAIQSEVEYARGFGFPEGGYDRLKNGSPYVVFREPQLRWGAPLMQLTKELATPRYRELSRRLLRNPHRKRYLEKLRQRTFESMGVGDDQEQRLPLLVSTDPETGEFLPQTRWALAARFLPLDLLPAYIWAALDMRRPSAERRFDLCYDGADEFVADFIDDWLAQSIVPDLWLYDDGSRLNIDAFYRSLSFDERADAAERLHAACYAGRERLLLYHKSLPPPLPEHRSIGIAVLKRQCIEDYATLRRAFSPAVARLFAEYKKRVGEESAATLGGFLEHLCARIEEARLPI